jgi:hypothetical protein
MIVWWLYSLQIGHIMSYYYIHEELNGTPQWYPPTTGVKAAPNRVWWSFITPLFFFTQEIFIIIWMYEYIFLQHFPQTHPLIYYHWSLSPKSDILILLSNSWNFNWTVLFKTRTLLLPMCRFHKKVRLGQPQRRTRGSTHLFCIKTTQCFWVPSGNKKWLLEIPYKWIFSRENQL